MSPPPSPSGRPAKKATAALVLLIAGLAILRLAAAGLIPLTEDEAYYRLWAQHPQLGYYDHPPMVAWWIWAGVRLLGDHALGVRLLPVLSSLITLCLVHDIGRTVGGHRMGLFAAWLYACTLTVGVGSILAIPDVPATLFWTLTLWSLVRAWTRDQAGWWALAGAAAGLACLSKYSALFLAPGVVLWLGSTPRGRTMLIKPWPWIAAAIAALIFAANVVWNAEHHWLTFAKQFGRVAPARLAPRYLGEFLAAQFVLLNPAVAVLAGIGAVRAWRERQSSGDDLNWLMAAASAPFLVYLALHSLHDRVQAHWPVPLYPAAALLAARAADGARGWRLGLARWAPLGLILTTLALAYMALPLALLGKADPALPLRDWQPFARTVEARRTRSGAAWVGVLSYGVNGQLQAQGLARAPIIQLNERDRYAERTHDLPPELGRPGLVVDLMRRIDRSRLARCFAAVGPTVEIDRGASGAADTRYGAVLVSGAKPSLLEQGCDN